MTIGSDPSPVRQPKHRDLPTRFRNARVTACPTSARQFVFGDHALAVLVEARKELGLRRRVLLQGELAGVARVHVLEDARIHLAIVRKFERIELVERHGLAAFGRGLKLLMQPCVELSMRDLAVAVEIEFRAEAAASARATGAS